MDVVLYGLGIGWRCCLGSDLVFNGFFVYFYYLKLGFFFDLVGVVLFSDVYSCIVDVGEVSFWRNKKFYMCLDVGVMDRKIDNFLF